MIKNKILHFAPVVLSIVPDGVLLSMVKLVPSFAYLLPPNILTLKKDYLNTYAIQVDTQYPIEKKLLSGRYDRDVTMSILKEVSPHDTCLDIGANIGVMTFAMLKSGAARVFAYEPGPLVRGRLEKNLEANSPASKLVTVRPVGLDEVQGSLFWNNQPHANSGNATLNDEDLSGENIVVPVTTLDQDLGDQKIDFIKIDVEGMEFKVLSGGKRLIEKNKPKILFETNLGHGPENLEQLCKMLEKWGYKLYDIKDGSKKTVSYPHLGSNCLAVYQASV